MVPERKPQSAKPSEADEVERLMTPLFELSESERKTEVERICRAHPDHAAEIRRRLHSVRLFLEPEGEEGFPEVLGDFHLRERLGRGGMGVVYRAEQVSLGRDVALKLIRPEQMYFDGARERFRRETEAIASLQHPGIVSIHVVGEDKGIPYFAMELLDGRGLDRVLAGLCDRAPESLSGAELGGPPGQESGRWVDACLELIRQVAEAVHHAHERGVIHRDIKPSNIMGMEEGRAVLLDFGLTSLATRSESHVTRPGAHIGTLAYMSPEQLSNSGVDPRSDVYSLGVTLYELLTLQVPFRESSALAQEKRILAGPPDSIRARNRGVSRDVEVVCLKAMAAQPRDRYATAQQLADDLANLLDRRPIAARPPGSAQRTWRWMQRNPARATSVGLAMALLVGLPTGLYWQQRRFNAELQNSLVREREANARAAQEHVIASEVTGFMEELFSHASPARTLGAEVPVSFLLDEGARRIESELQDQPAVRSRLLQTFGTAYGWLGAKGRSEEFLRESLELQLGIMDALHPRALLGRLQLDLVTFHRGAYQECANLMEPVVEQEMPQDAEAIALYARCMSRYGYTLSRLGRLEEAEKWIQRSLQVHRGLNGEITFDEAISLADAAGFLMETGRREEAVEKFKTSARILREVLPDSNPNRVLIELDLTQTLMDLGRFQEAELRLDGLMGETQQVFGNDHPRCIPFLIPRSRLLREQGEFSESEACLRRALAIHEGAGVGDSPQLAWILNDLALVVEVQGRYAEADPLLARALELERRFHPSDHSRLAISLTNRANLLMQRERFEEARALAQESVAMHRRLFGSSARLSSALLVLGNAQVWLGQMEAARNTYRDALAMLSEDDVQLSARIHGAIALVQNLRRDGVRGEQAARRSLEVESRDALYRARSLHCLGWARLLQGDVEAGRKFLKQSVAMFDRLFPEGHVLAAFPWNQLGESWIDESPEEAMVAFENAVELRERYSASPHWRSISLSNLAASLYYQKEVAEALSLVEQAVELRRGIARGPDIDLANMLYLTANCFAEEGDVEQAWESAHECWSEQKALYPPDHPIPWRTASLLGDLATQRQRFEEAEQLLQDAWAGLKRAGDGSQANLTERRLENLRAARLRAAQGLKGH